MNFNEITTMAIGQTAVNAVYYGSQKLWPTTIDYSRQYLTIESRSNNNNIYWKLSDASATAKQIQYSIDKTNWTNVTSSTSGTLLTTLNSGDKLYLKGSNTQYGTSNSYYNYFYITGSCDVYGNLLSLSYSDNYIGQTTLSDAYTYPYLFKSNPIIDASNLILNATTLTNYCYRGMFYSCSQLTNVPNLPALTLSTGCYSYMFEGCTSLESIPSDMLPATTLANNCYMSIFANTGLFDLSELLLPATTLASGCYRNMFYGCTSLYYAPELPATTLAASCYKHMFYGCTSLEYAPDLPAMILEDSCYNNMFNGCTNLGYVSCNAVKRYAITDSEFTNWLNGVSQNGIIRLNKHFGKIPFGSVNGIPSGWSHYVSNGNSYSIDIKYHEYFSIVSLEDNNSISIFNSDNSPSISFEYSKNKSNWTSVTIPLGGSSTTSTFIVSLDKDEVLYFRGSNTYFASSSNYYHSFRSSGQFNVQGNIMSLFYGDNFLNKQSFPSDSNYILCGLFRQCGTLVSAEDLGLPVLSLIGTNMYSRMFYQCTLLTTPPDLPASNLGSYSYYQMFNECTSLTTIPDITGMIVSGSVYSEMFKRCRFTDARYGASGLPLIFYNSSLKTGSQHLNDMFRENTNLIYAPSLPYTNLGRQSYRQMFKGCTALTTAPILSATTLAEYCYQNMFDGCTKLSSITCLAEEIITGSLSNWVANVSATGTFTKKSTTTFTTGNSGIPSGWTVVNV